MNSPQGTWLGPDAFADLLLEGRPLLDVRAPVEFLKGAIPHASNHPLLNDDERERLGAATSRKDRTPPFGWAIAWSAGTPGKRIQAWSAWAEAHPTGALYCFRGGRRSQITQSWLAEAGVELPGVTGGYKALRQYLLDVIDRESPAFPGA